MHACMHAYIHTYINTYVHTEWCISSMICSGDTPFWSETLDIYIYIHNIYVIQAYIP